MDALHQPDRVSELDALRGLSAVAVVLYHYTVFMPEMLPGTPRIGWAASWGCYGVQLFFAISGFVILMSLERHRTAPSFVASRARRLYPTYWLALAVTTTGVALLGPARLQVGAGAALANLPMGQLLTGAPMVDGAYWSLSVELAFYACMLVAARAGWLGHVERLVVGWLALKWLWWAVPVLPAWLGLLLVQAHIPYFAIGMLACRVWRGERRWWEQAPVAMLVLGTILVIDPIQAHWIGGGLVVGFALLATGRLRWLAAPPLLWLGGVSYPLYLVHQYLGYAVILRLEAAGLSPVAAIALTIGMMLVLADALKRAVPTITRGWRADEGKVLAAA